MSEIRSLLRIPPVVDALIAALLMAAMGGLSSIYGGDQLRYVMFAVGVLSVVWVTVSTIRYMTSKQSLDGALGGWNLESAMKALLKSLGQGNRFSTEDAALTLPWFVMIGAQNGSHSALLKQAGFTSVIELRGTGSDAVVVGELWLSPIYGSINDGRGGGHRMVIWEFSAAAVADERFGREVMRWLSQRQPQLAGLLFVAGADAITEIGDDEAAARSQAREAARSLERISRAIPGALKLYVLWDRCDQLNGFRRMFSGRFEEERQAWGFATEARPRQEELVAHFGELQSIVEAQTVLQLPSVSTQAEREELLDFPRELARLAERASYFIEELLRQAVQAELQEVLFCSSAREKPTPAPLSKRRRELPAPLPDEAVQRPLNQSLFSDGAFERIALNAEANTPGVRRQWVTLTMSAMLTLICTGLLGYMTQSRYLLLDQLQDQLTETPQADARQPVAVRSAEANRLINQFNALEQLGDVELAPASPTKERTLAAFLERVGTVEQSTTKVAALLAGLKLSESASGDLQEAINRYVHLRSAAILVAPLLLYVQMDWDARRELPIHDALSLLQGQGRSGYFLQSETPSTAIDSSAARRVLADDRLPARERLRRGFDALRAVALLNEKDKCELPDDAPKWLANYLAEKWRIGADRQAIVGKRLEKFFGLYLGKNGRPYPKLELRGRDRRTIPLSDLRALFAPAGNDGSNAATVFQVMVLETFPKEPKIAFLNDPTSQPLFNTELIPLEMTEAGCRALEQQYGQPISANAAASARVNQPMMKFLKCALSINPPQAPLQDSDLRAYYAEQMAKTWAEWLTKIQYRAVTRLDEVEAFAGSLPTLLAELLRQIGAPPLPKQGSSKDTPPLEDFCNTAMLPFEPLRDAIRKAGEEGRSAPQAVAFEAYKMALQDYLRALKAVSGSQLPAANPPEPSSPLLTAIESLNRVTAARRRFMETLRQQVGRDTPKDRQFVLGNLDQALARIEDNLLDVTIQSVRTTINTEWVNFRNGWQTQPPAADGAAANVSPEEGARRPAVTRLNQFVTSFVQPFFLPASCEEKSFGPGTPPRKVLCSKVCLDLRDLITKFRKFPIATPEPRPDPGTPRIIARNNSKCDDRIIKYVRLDMGEAPRRFRCKLSDNAACDTEAGAAQPNSSRATISLAWRSLDGEERPPQFEPPIHNEPTMRALLEKLLPEAKNGHHEFHEGPEPVTNDRRVIIPISISSCKNEPGLQLYLNTGYVRHVLSGPVRQTEAPWMRAEGLPGMLPACGVDPRPGVVR